MVSWILIGILILLGFLIIKIGHFKHSFFIIMLILLGLFLYATMSYVAEKNKLDLSTTKGFFHATNVYIWWLANGFDNIKELTARTVKMDWRSTNSTFSRGK